MHVNIDMEKKLGGSSDTDLAANEKNREDVDLAKRAQKDRKAAEELVGRLAPKVRYAVYLAVGSDQESDDLAHLCLVKILENLKNFRGTGSIEAWAGRLSYRVLMRHLTRRRRSERTVSLVPDEIGTTGKNPEYESERARLRKRLAFHLQKMPEERRLVLVLRLVYQYSVAEVAEITGAPVNTVRDRIRVGLKEIRKSILRDNEACEFLGEERHG